MRTIHNDLGIIKNSTLSQQFGYRFVEEETSRPFLAMKLRTSITPGLASHSITSCIWTIVQLNTSIRQTSALRDYDLPLMIRIDLPIAWPPHAILLLKYVFKSLPWYVVEVEYWPKKILINAVFILYILRLFSSFVELWILKTFVAPNQFFSRKLYC